MTLRLRLFATKKRRWGVGQEYIGPAKTVWPTGQESDAAQRAAGICP